MNGSDSNNNTLYITSGLAGIRKGMKTARLASVVASSLLVLSLSGCAKKTTEDHLSAAAEFAKDGDNNAAVVELKNAIQLSPKMANARLELGKVYLNLSQYEPAEKELNKALELGASEVDVIPFLARAYQGIGATSALEVIDHDLAGLTTVQKVEVGYFKAQSLIQLQKIDEARVLIEQLVVLDTNSAYKGLSSVLKMVLDGENENALELAIQLQAQAPLNKDVLNITARLYFLNQQPEKAADVYASYVKAAPKDIETKFRLAAMLVEQGRSKEAEPYVDELMELNDQNPLLNQLKGIIKATYEDYPAAQRFSETAINNGSNDPIVRMVAGYSAFKQGDFESASGHFETIASVLPDNHPALRMLAASQLQIGKTTEATDVLARLDELTPEDASLFSKAGYELLRSGNVTQAKGLVDKATGISDSSDDLLRLGVLKLELNNIEGVLDLENAVAKSPESVTARSTLATAYLASNKLDEASKLATTWKAENGDQPGGFLLAGQIALRQDDLQLARNEFMTAAVVAPDNNMVRMSLIGLDILEKKNDEALKQVESLLKDSPDFAPAINAYFSLMSEKDKAEAGMQPALSSLKNNADNSLLRTTIARMYLSQSKEAEAMDMLNAVPADASAPQQYWLAKGLLHLKNKENAAAREHYETWLEVSPNNPDAVLGNLLILDSQNQYPSIRLTYQN
jgi:putative PEP-CTERM system TPR-repeat lipoprotein